MMNIEKKSKKQLVYVIEELVKKKIKKKRYCEICGSTGQLHAHHIEGKSTYFLRIYEKNMICLCARCHKFGDISAHSTSFSGQLEFFKKLINVKGIKTLNHLKTLKHKNIEMSKDELITLYNQLKKEVS